jgi:hypothetical protein
VPNVQWKTPDDGQRNCPKHVEFPDKINLGNQCVCWFIKKKFVTMHDHMNVKLVPKILFLVVGIILILDQSLVVTSVINLTAFICRAKHFLDEVTKKKNIFTYCTTHRARTKYGPGH